MNLKALSGIMLTLLLIGMLALAFNIQPAKASGTIYIRADGSVDPPTAPISSANSIIYTFTRNIIYDKVVVQRDNIVIDGKGFTLEGTGAFDTKGIDLSSRNNVTVKNVKVIKCYDGIFLGYGTMGNILSGNDITNNTVGVHFEGSGYNIISRNNITNNNYGISFSFSSNNNISKNDITDNWRGIRLSTSDNNIIYGNTISGSDFYGVEIFISNENKFYHNTFINNDLGNANIDTSSNNIWDDGYPSGGNYYIDFEEKYPTVEDAFSGEFQNETGSDGIWDHPYLVDAEDVDHYPLVPEFPSFLILPLFMIATLLAVSVRRRKHACMRKQFN